MNSMNMKQIGFIILGLSVLLFIVMISFVNELQLTTIEQCACAGGSCPMDSSLPVQGYLGFSLVAITGGIGGILVFTSKKDEKAVIKKSKEIKQMLKNLNKDQKKTYNLIESSGGVIFQADLVDKSGFSKVKVSRILDKLEGKGLVEKRRRGMSNIVLAKKS